MEEEGRGVGRMDASEEGLNRGGGRKGWRRWEREGSGRRGWEKWERESGRGEEGGRKWGQRWMKWG